MDKTAAMTIGCNLGDRFSRMCVLDDTGMVVEEQRVRTTPDGMKTFFAGRSRARIVVEVGSHSRWVNALLVELGHDVIVANPRQVPLISQSQRKTDRRDAEILARLGRVDQRLLSPVRHRSASVQTDLAMVRARDVLVQERTRLVNHVRGMAKSIGHRFRRCSAASFHRSAVNDMPPSLASALMPIISCIEHLSEQIGSYDERLTNRAREKYPATQVLEQVPGIGMLTALTFVLTLEEPTRFKKSRDVGGFLGLVPRKEQTGESDPQRRITKAGDRYLRRLLVNCSQFILGPFGPPTDLRNWGLELSKRGGKNAKKRAVVAVARKLAVLLHRLWITGEAYEPLRAQAAA
jgi:transposase